MKGVTEFEKLRKIASEASYHYVLSRKLIKNAKNSRSGDFENLKLTVKQCYQTSQFW